MMENQSPSPAASEGKSRSRLSHAWGLLKRGVGGAFVRLKKAGKKDRDVHYTREDQLTMAAIVMA